MKYVLHFESGTKGFHTIADAQQAARTLTAPWKITRGKWVMISSDGPQTRINDGPPWPISR